jgi:hypothetical protein
VTPAPLDGLLERYAGDPAVPARLSGRARVETTLAAARAARAEVVVHLVEPDDETCSWELPALRRRLGDVRLRLVTARLNGDDPAPLLAVAAAATSDRG